MSATRLKPYRIQVLDCHGFWHDESGKDDPYSAHETACSIAIQGQSARILFRGANGEWLPASTHRARRWGAHA